jgi:rsbT co-antagonist protein RsbR
MDQAIQVIKEHIELYVDRSIDRVLADGVPLYVNMPRDVLRTAVTRAMGMVVQDVVQGTTTSYPSYMKNIGVQRAKIGVPIGDMIRGLDHGFQVISDHLDEVFGDDLRPRLWWESRKHEIGYAGILAINEAFYQTREAIISQQHQEIVSLSAPVLPLAEGILVLPIVGSLNEERSALVIETLLDRIIKHSAEVVIIDVTGMHTMDESATTQLLRAAHAARLLGAKILLVGIRAEIAMTFTRGSADLGNITTLADLTQGLSHALRLRQEGRTSLRQKTTGSARSPRNERF